MKIKKAFPYFGIQLHKEVDLKKFAEYFGIRLNG